MGAGNSRHNWEPPPEPVQMSDVSSPVDYYAVGAEVTLNQKNECSCYPRTTVTMDSDELYSMLSEQYHKGYRMLHFTRAPCEMNIRLRDDSLRVIFQGYFKMNPNLGERYGDPISWELRIVRSWIQTQVITKTRWSSESKRVVNTTALVDDIARNTQDGARLVSATATGHCELQTKKEQSSDYGPYMAMDLFFEVPCPVPSESYIYNIALVPVRVEFPEASHLFFPYITCDWTAVFNSHLQQGWRLIDIYIDYPMLEQLNTPPKTRRYLCINIDTDALWIFEKPRSRQADSIQEYEGTIVEQEVHVKASKSGQGVQSSHNWMETIRDMGSRGWELACVVECHAVEVPSIKNTTLKSLLFFQRPLV